MLLDPLTVSKHDSCTAPIPSRNRADESLCVGVTGILQDRIRCTGLDDCTSVHDGDTTCKILDDGKIVGDEKIGHLKRVLQVEQQIDDLRLNRYV
jgi:hypothetical protein